MGFYRPNWDIDGGIGFYRSDTYGEWDRSSELGLDTWLSFNYRPASELPTFGLSVSTSRWQADYASAVGAMVYDSWELIQEMGFTRFVDDWFGWDPETSALDLIVGLAGDLEHNEWSNVAERNREMVFFVGVTGKAGLYEH